jgi:hypothetical protein
MRHRLILLVVVFFSLSAWSCAQNAWPSSDDRADILLPAFPYSNPLPQPLPLAPQFKDESGPPAIAVALPRMAPELALQAYRGHTIVQAAQLSSYSAKMMIRADLPDTKQSGEYTVDSYYSAPHHLSFKPVSFTGDSFVKGNVILRILQSEVDHLKDDPALNAISPANYKFSYKGTTEIGNRVVHVYQIKPRQKRAGLFKGKIYLDVLSGSMVRAEGKLVKSPSLFVKKLEFVQDYADVDSFTFPTHIHSEAQARIIGRTIVDIYQSNYQAVSNVAQAKSSPAM